MRSSQMQIALTDVLRGGFERGDDPTPGLLHGIVDENTFVRSRNLQQETAVVLFLQDVKLGNVGNVVTSVQVGDGVSLSFSPSTGCKGDQSKCKVVMTAYHVQKYKMQGEWTLSTHSLVSCPCEGHSQVHRESSRQCVSHQLRHKL